MPFDTTFLPHASIHEQLKYNKETGNSVIGNVLQRNMYNILTKSAKFSTVDPCVINTGKAEIRLQRVDEGAVIYRIQTMATAGWCCFSSRGRRERRACKGELLAFVTKHLPFSSTDKDLHVRVNILQRAFFICATSILDLAKPLILYNKKQNNISFLSNTLCNINCLQPK